VDAYMDNDPSKATKGEYSIQVDRRPLGATISGGSLISASTTRPLVLDGSGSIDPDYTGAADAPDADLKFRWSCTISDGDVDAECRAKDGSKLTLPETSVVMLMPDILSTLYQTDEHPYVFKVSVSKGSKAPSTFSMPVTLTEAAIPAVSVSASSGKQMPSGVVRINPSDQLVVFGECSVTHEDLAADLQVTWTFEPAIDQELLEVIPDLSITDSTRNGQTLVVGAGLDAFMPGSTYTVKFTCVDALGETSTSSLKLAVNAPPRGNPCSICRLEGTECALDQPKSGDAIFDTFRYSCDSWADADAPIQYKFAYSGVFDGKFSEVVFDWGTSPTIDLVLPPGEVFVKAKVRDGFGASTRWKEGGNIFVGTGGRRRRNLLEAADRFAEGETLLRDTLLLADYAKINQLAGALAMEVDTRVADNSDTASAATIKKEVLLEVLQSAVAAAIRTEGYVCESLSGATAISNNVNHISVKSIGHLSHVIEDLSTSEQAASLSSECAQNILLLVGSAFEAAHTTEECLATGLVNSAEQTHMREFLTKADTSFESVLRKVALDLLAGQSVKMQDSSDSASDFSYSVSKISPAGNLHGTLAPMEGSSDILAYQLPDVLKQDARVSSQSAVSILFGASAHPPAIEGINPISPVVSLSLADGAGVKLDVQQLTDPVTITIPLTTDSLCAAERRLWTGKGRCMYFDPQAQQYSADGCTTVQDSDTSVTCQCTHLTSFIVEVLIFDWFGIHIQLMYDCFHI